MGGAAAIAQVDRSQRRAPPAPHTQQRAGAPEQAAASPGVPQFLEARGDAAAGDTEIVADAGGAPAPQRLDAALSRSSEALDSAPGEQEQQVEEPTPVEPGAVEAPVAGGAGPAHHGATQSEARPVGPPPLELGDGGPGRGGGNGAAGAGGGEGGAGGAGAEGGEGSQAEAGEPAAPEGEASGAAAEGGAGPGGAGEGAADGGGGGGGGGLEGDTAGAAPAGEVPADGGLEALATGDIALIDEELAEHQRWGAASARVGAAGSSRRAGFIVDQAGSGALGGLGHGALMGAAVGAGSQALEIGAGRLVARLAGPALARSFPLPAIGAVIGGVFSAYDLATRDWGHTGETIGRFGEGGSIYEQLANSIAAVSEIIGIATAVLNVIAGVIGAISIAMWVITVLTVGVASPLAATLSTIAMAIGLATMVLDGINALVLQRLVTLFRALHTFTSQADPTDVEQQGGRIAAAAGASAGFVGGMAGGLAGGGATAAGARRLGIGHAPPHVPDVEPPRAAAGEGPTITADPPPPVETGVPGGDRPAMLPPEPTAPRPVSEPGVPAVDPHGPTMPAPAPVDPHAPTMPAPAPVDPHAPTMPAPAPVDPHAPTLPAPPPVDPHAPTMPMPEVVDPHAPTALPPDGGMPEIPGPPRVPEFEPLPDYGPELPGWNPDAPSPYAPTQPPPAPVEVPTPSRAPTEPVTPSRAPTEPATPSQRPGSQPQEPPGTRMAGPESVDPNAPTPLPPGGGMPEIPGPPRVPEFEPLPDYGPELPDWNPAEPSPYAPTQPPPAPVEVPVPSSVPPERVTPLLPPPEPVTPRVPPGEPVTPSQAPGARPAEPPAGRRMVDDQSLPASSEAAPPSALPEAQQLSLPGLDATPAPPQPATRAAAPATPAGPTGGQVRALTEPLSLAGFTGAEPIPQGLEPGSIGHYGRAVAEPHPAALASNPPGAPGATSGGGRMPQSGRQQAGVYYEHQTPAAVAHEVLPGHQYDSPSGRRRGGRDTVEALTISFPEAAKPIKDPLDAALLAEVRARQAAGERVSPVEVTVRGAQHSQQALAQSGANVPPEQVSRTFLAEMDQFHSERFGYREVRPGEALPPGHPLRDVPQAEIDAHIANIFEPHVAPPGTQLALPGMAEHAPRPAVPPAEQLSLPLPEMPDPRQGVLPFEGPAARPVSDAAPAGPRPAGEGGTRNQQPLSAEEFAAFAAMAEQMGVPRERIQQVAGSTAYLPGSFDQLLIGPDIRPLPPEARPQGLANPANAALEPRAVLGHEIIGHREAELAGQARIEPWHEEFQASTRAALHTPDLPREQMWLLTQDAAARRRHQSREGTIFVDTERYGPPQPGGRRRQAASRAPHAPPSVIVDPALGGARPLGEAGVPLQRRPSPSPPVATPYPSVGGLLASSAAARGSTHGGSGSQPTDAAPRDAATARSAGFAGTARGAAVASVNPAARMLWGAYFGQGSREQRIGRGGGVGAVIGGAAGGPLGAYVGRRVGEGVARRAEDFNAGLERGAEAIVEPVNPAYPPPPGSGSRQDIADMQNSLLGILQARAQAEALQSTMAGDAAHHEGNAGPLAEFNQRNAQALSATQAHQQATARRTAANQQQQQQEGSVTGTIEDYGNRAAGLAMITGPLEAFTRFTYLAHALPDSPDVLRGAKRGILKMNSDGQSFLDALGGVDSAVAGQQAAQPARSSGIAANAGRLATTAGGAVASQSGLAQSGAQGQALAARNAARSADSRQREAQAAQTGAQLDSQAEDTRTRIATLSEQWQAWASAHRQARIDAMARTRAAMVERGWRPREESAGGGS
ncbi:MAG: hypothetical protein H6947_03175 [Zoogloeaceae bacterium]|nr:hypothetical protein [Zoogloeaceae bacterium]